MSRIGSRADEEVAAFGIDRTESEQRVGFERVRIPFGLDSIDGVVVAGNDEIEFASAFVAPVERRCAFFRVRGQCQRSVLTSRDRVSGRPSRLRAAWWPESHFQSCAQVILALRTTALAVRPGLSRLQQVSALIRVAGVWLEPTHSGPERMVFFQVYRKKCV